MNYDWANVIKAKVLELVEQWVIVLICNLTVFPFVFQTKNIPLLCQVPIEFSFALKSEEFFFFRNGINPINDVFLKSVLCVKI